ncbi:MAG: type II toxin-antitoxin system HicB family antitoxin [Chloroflexi bacterium]|nr:type II toxin-antitoxin system HicB family antitoxin [Chloroflexota bacterium]
MRQIILYKGEDGFWVVGCPSLPGCISQGKTREEAIANIKEAIAGYILVLQEDGLPVPEDRLLTVTQYHPQRRWDQDVNTAVYR